VANRPGLTATQPEEDIEMGKDFSLDSSADGWFPDGIEILPLPSYLVVIVAVLAAFVAAIATAIR
jgi:hypothetical protein